MPSLELTFAISALMHGRDPERLKEEYGTEVVEQAMTVLENRI
jgi:hypothetical protein